MVGQIRFRPTNTVIGSGTFYNINAKVLPVIKEVKCKKYIGGTFAMSALSNEVFWNYIISLPKSNLIYLFKVVF